MGCDTRTRLALFLVVAFGCGETSGKEGAVRYRADASRANDSSFTPDSPREASGPNDATSRFDVSHNCRFVEPQEVTTKLVYLASGVDGFPADQAVTIEAIEVGEMLGRVGTRWRYSFADLINEETWVSIDEQCQRWILSGSSWVLSRPDVEPATGQLATDGDGQPLFSWATEASNEDNAASDCRRLLGMQQLGLLNIAEELLCSGTGAVEIVGASGSVTGTLTLAAN